VQTFRTNGLDGHDFLPGKILLEFRHTKC
jgi:hypothetical protein